MKRLLIPMLLLAVTGSAFAQNGEDRTSRITRISKLSATTSGDRGTFTVPAVETLNENQWSFGISWNNFDRTPRDLDINSFPVFFSGSSGNRVGDFCAF